MPAVIHSDQGRENAGVVSPVGGAQDLFGEECTLPMDMGLPRDTDTDPIQNLYALWV